MSVQETLENLAQKGREALRYLETDIAWQIYKNVLEIDDGFTDGWVGLGQVYYETGELKEAEKAYQHALNLVNKQLGKSWQQRKMSWQQDKYKPIIRLVHGFGLLCYRQGKNKEAQKWFELEHNLDPKLEAPLSMLNDIKAGRKFNKLKYQSTDS